MRPVRGHPRELAERRSAPGLSCSDVTLFGRQLGATVRPEDAGADRVAVFVKEGEGVACGCEADRVDLTPRRRVARPRHRRALEARGPPGPGVLLGPAGLR